MLYFELVSCQLGTITTESLLKIFLDFGLNYGRKYCFLAIYLDITSFTLKAITLSLYFVSWPKHEVSMVSFCVHPMFMIVSRQSCLVNVQLIMTLEATFFIQSLMNVYLDNVQAKFELATKIRSSGEIF